MDKANGGNHPVKYKATMARARWRALYSLAEKINPSHKASQAWLTATAAELFEIAEVKIKAGGNIFGKPFDAKRSEELVTLELTRAAVLGIKFSVIEKLKGDENRKPASLNERRDLLEAVSGIGPDGKLRRLVEAESKLPESDDLEDEKLFEDEDGGDLEAETPAEEPAKAPVPEEKAKG